MVSVASVNLLKSVPCFANLSLQALGLLLSSARERPFVKGEIVLLEGEPCPGLFVVKSGSVKLYRISPSGDEQIMRTVYPGGCFECAPIFDGGPNPVSAQALEASRLVFIPIANFQATTSAYPEIVVQLAPILAMRLRDLLTTVEDFSFSKVSARLARLLLQLGERQGTHPTETSRPLTQQHLACVVGCSRQVLNSSLRDLVRKGIIKTEKRRIIVLKPEALMKLAFPDSIDQKPL
ncbi:MAG: Crp/Fnr family transcriptional regulator [Chloroflexi bacterium]|nr:Crp/Fnr family transcriptional regulator [Chloroflexota bacterium]